MLTYGQGSGDLNVREQKFLFSVGVFVSMQVVVRAIMFAFFCLSESASEALHFMNTINTQEVMTLGRKKSHSKLNARRETVLRHSTRNLTVYCVQLHNEWYNTQ